MSTLDSLLSSDVPEPPPGPDDDQPRLLSPGRSISDQTFRWGTRSAASVVLILMGFIGLFLLLRATQALHKAGFGFLTEKRWLPDVGHFGIEAVFVGTVMIALTALVIAVPISFGAAIFITDYAPRRLRRPLVSLVDLMAAIPSIVYGLWGLIFLQPHILSFANWLTHHLGFIPIFKTNKPDYTSSTFIAGVVVSLMVMPIACSVMREVFSQAPQGEKEGAYALGATRWGVVKTVVLPWGRAGMVGATMLGLGRALGETIAVYLIISPIFESPGRMIHIVQGGGISISSLIALRYGDSSSFGISALFAAGLVLFVATLIVNSLASLIVNRSRSGAATDI
jgi:phosphate transport system permease protein